MLRGFLKMIQEHVATRKEGLNPDAVTDPRWKNPTYSLKEVWKTAVRDDAKRAGGHEVC